MSSIVRKIGMMKDCFPKVCPRLVKVKMFWDFASQNIEI
jgi:hypothetical protein